MRATEYSGLGARRQDLTVFDVLHASQRCVVDVAAFVGDGQRDARRSVRQAVCVCLALSPVLVVEPPPPGQAFDEAVERASITQSLQEADKDVEFSGSTLVIVICKHGVELITLTATSNDTSTEGQGVRRVSSPPPPKREGLGRSIAAFQKQ
jgi:hypothetical protein